MMTVVRVGAEAGVSAVARLVSQVMSPAGLYLKSRFAAATSDRVQFARIALLVALHLAALAVLLWTEEDWAARLAFALTWGFLNFFWLALLRRPTTAAALSLAMIVVLILLSQFKQGVTMMTVTFVDVMLIDSGTFSFLLTIIPGLAWKVGLAVALVAAVLALLWRFEPFKVRQSLATLGSAACLAALIASRWRCRSTARTSSIPINMFRNSPAPPRSQPSICDQGSARRRCDGDRQTRCGRYRRMPRRG